MYLIIIVNEIGNDGIIEFSKNLKYISKLEWLSNTCIII